MKTIFTDLDGTFIPEDELSRSALKDFKYYLKNNNDLKIVYVTGRNLKETKLVINLEKLPSPNHVICDVGTTIYKKGFLGYNYSKGYHKKQEQIISNSPKDEVISKILKMKGVELQEKTKQRPFKLSFYFDYDKINDYKFDDVTQGCSWNKVLSVDKNGIGLLDLLPKGINKYSAIDFFINNYGLSKSDCVFAGDSGNDLEVFCSDIKSIVVDNCTQSVKQAVCSRKNVYISPKKYTTGVLDGCKYYGFI